MKTDGFPCVTDDEPGIVDAINNKTNLHRLGCWRHVMKSNDHWLVDNNATKGQKAVYKDNVGVFHLEIRRYLGF